MDASGIYSITKDETIQYNIGDYMNIRKI